MKSAKWWSVRGGKKFKGGNRSFLKRKKAKFDFRKASYIKEREERNEKLETRRKIAEEEKKARLSQISEHDSSDYEEEDPIKSLLSTFPSYKEPKAISSESESSDESFDVQNISDIYREEVSGDKFRTSKKPSDYQCREKKKKKNFEEESKLKVKREKKSEEIIIRTKKDETEAGQEAKQDPFSIHLSNDLDEKLYEAVSTALRNIETTALSWPILGKLVCEIPKPYSGSEINKMRKINILDKEKQYANCGTVPSLIEIVDLDKLYIKPQIQNNFFTANKKSLKGKEPNLSSFTPLQRELFSIINNYQDLCYYERKFSNADEIRFVYCLHIINHMLKTRTKIVHHNAKLAKFDRPVPEEYKDQGLVRPKVLVIVPFRHSCLKIVETLTAILLGEEEDKEQDSVLNKAQFVEDFTGNKLAMPKRNRKPDDYELTFQGNIDDKFKIGIAITKKKLKLYAKFYSSDIIIASPLALRQLIGTEGEAERDYDFLASIELLIMDQIELITMQNWDHLHHILKHLNLQPKKTHDTNIHRLRTWCLNGWAKYYRQTLIFSGMELQHINGTVKKTCFNYAGKVKVTNPVEPGSIYDVTVTIPHIFYKFDASDHVQAIDSRMGFFLKEVLPEYRDPVYKNHTLIFVPSYYDFVSLRSHMMKEDLSFVQICEYTEDAKVARARDMFFHGDAHFLLYTERFHFYRRPKIKGIRHLIFYQLPIFPQLYSEMCNLMLADYQNPRGGTTYNMSVTVIYNKFDCYELSRVVGEQKAAKMISSELKYHKFTCSSV